MTATRELSQHSGLDGLRGVAILAVLGTHVVFLDQGSATWALRGGFLGVDVFLVLSGFLIGGVLVREVTSSGGIDGGRFARRRATRLLPSLVVFLVLQSAGSLLIGSSWSEQARQIILALTFTANWQIEFGHYPPFEVVHLWSLSLEVQFYAMAAVLVWALRRRLGSARAIVAGLLGAAVVVMCWRWFLYERGAEVGSLYERTDTRADSLFLGIAGLIVWREQLVPDRMLRLAGSLGLLVLIGCFVFAGHTDPWLYRAGFTFIALAAAAAVAAAATGTGLVARVGNLRWLCWVGTISFSLYLWHMPLYIWTIRVLPDAPLWLKALIAVPSSFLAAIASFRLVESRTLDVWRGGSRQSQAPTSNPSGTDTR